MTISKNRDVLCDFNNKKRGISMRVKELAIHSLNAETFKVFGCFIDKPEGKPTIELDGFFKYYDGVASLEMQAPSGIGILEVYKREPVLGLIEMHEKSPEVLVALDTDFHFVVVNSDDTGKTPFLETARAFLLKQGQAVVLNPGVWHWIPFPLRNSGKLMVIIKAGTSENDLLTIDLEKELDSPFRILLAD